MSNTSTNNRTVREGQPSPGNEVSRAVETAAYAGATYDNGTKSAWDLKRRISAAMLDEHSAQEDLRHAERRGRGVPEARVALAKAAAQEWDVYDEAADTVAAQGWTAPPLKDSVPFTGDPDDGSYCGHSD
jgi:hypothetical protein